MTKVFKLKSHSKHPRNSPMLAEIGEKKEILIHTYRRGTAVTFKVDKEVLKVVKSFLKAPKPSLDLLLHVLTEFKEQQTDVVELFEEIVDGN